MESRAKMTSEHRAKQFAPFAAITGLDRAIARERHALELTERRELPDDSAGELDERLRALRRGMRVSVGYYADGEYRSTSGVAERIDPVQRLLKVGTDWIPFADIPDIFLDRPLPFPEE